MTRFIIKDQTKRSCKISRVREIMNASLIELNTVPEMIFTIFILLIPQSLIDLALSHLKCDFP